MTISNPTTNIFTGQPLGLGPVKYGSEEISGWFYHKAVRVGDTVFDRVTGSAGMHINEYKKLFQYSDELIFK